MLKKSHMSKPVNRSLRTIALMVFMVSSVVLNASQKTGAQKSILWADPGDIRSRNLYWGPGGQEHQPQPPFEFEGEDLHGTSPKFYVRDSRGKRWTAKLGLEAKPETAASRLLWAVGYAANVNYFYPHIEVKKMPAHLRRGKNLTDDRGDVPSVRLQRHAEKERKAGNWNWRHNPFYGTRQFNGLRIMMGLIGNWDLNDQNNAIREAEADPGPEVYEVTDVGTAFGTPGKSYNDRVSKGNLAAYQRAKLIAHVHPDSIDLNFPKRPPLTELFEFEWIFFFHQLKIRWIGKNIPRADAKWIGSLLSELSSDQIADAFRAAGYSEAQVDAYTHAVIARIQELDCL